MPIRVPWDQFEVALLIDAYIHCIHGKDLSQTAQELSDRLRGLAIRRGIEIDDTYRNVNGMKMQLGNVQYLFTNGERGLSGASAMIHQMVEMYRNEPTRFQVILKEAFQLTGKPVSVEEAFFAYARVHTRILEPVLRDMLAKASDYCHLQHSILGTTDVKAVRNVQERISQGKLLRFRFGKDAQRIREVTQLYYSFVKSYHDKPSAPIFAEDQTQYGISLAAAQKASPEAVNAKLQTQDKQITSPLDKTPIIDTPAILVRTALLDTAVQEEKQVTSVAEVPAFHASGVPFEIKYEDGTFFVDFSKDGTYDFTQPVAFTYRGDRHAVTSWSSLYLDLCRLLFADHTHEFMSIMNSDIPGYNALSFADEVHKHDMRYPRSFAPGYYLEANISATHLVRRIRGLYKLCKLDDQLSIEYHSTKTAAEMPAEPLSDWIITYLNIKKITYKDKRSNGGNLWIRGDMQLPISINECHDHHYRLHYKADGCTVWPGEPAWWTNDRPAQKKEQPNRTTLQAVRSVAKPVPQKPQPQKPNSQLKTQPQPVKPTSAAPAKRNTAEFRQKLEGDFRNYLTKNQRLASGTVAQYCQSVEAVEQFLIMNNYGLTLDVTDAAEAQRVFDILMNVTSFVDWNNQRHHQYSAALKQYVGFLRTRAPKATSITKPNSSHPADAVVNRSSMSVKDVAAMVLRLSGRPMTGAEILSEIQARGLYKFNTDNPFIIVYQAIRRHCKGIDDSGSDKDYMFERIRDESGQVRYILYGDDRFQRTEKAIAEPVPQPRQEPPADDRWLPILQESFPDGYILDDFLSQFQAGAYWQERYGEACPLEGAAIDDAIRSVGTVRDGRVLLKSDEDQKLISTICEEIDDILSKYTNVYRSCVYERYQDQLAACAIYTEAVMTEQILAAAKGRFISQWFIFARPGKETSVAQDCRTVLREHGGAMHVNDVAKVLWFIPRDYVYHNLSTDGEALNLGNSTWMLAEHFPLTREDADKIGDMLDEYFLSNSYIQAFDLPALIRKQLPFIAENLSGMTYGAVFNITEYYLKNRFSFTKAIISPKGVTVEFTDMFKAFGAEHETFTMEDLEAFAGELKLPIYWECLYEGGAVRVSKTEFVNRSLIHFDVDATDRVLEDICPGDYLPFQAVSSAMMMHLPSCGYSWNGYLLLSYVQGFSKAFRASYNSLGKTGCYGAMVRRSCKMIHNYASLLEQVLTDDDSWTTASEALSLLVKEGYQAQMRYGGINAIVEQAKKNKQAMQDGK